MDKLTADKLARSPVSGRTGPLTGLKAVSLAQNLPGPVALALLVADGMSATKVEPPAGDLLRYACPTWYAELNEGVEAKTLDLRSELGGAALHELLADADLLITSQRPAALERLGLTSAALSAAFPDLCWVEIVGDLEAPEVPGHDLTYQLDAGLLTPPAMPRTLIADLGGARDAAGAALMLLLARERGSAERHRRVGLKQAAEGFAAPVRHGITEQGGGLSGAMPAYRLFALADGWAAVAAIEPHFAQRFTQVAGADPGAFFASRTVSDVGALARENDLPISTIAGI